MNTKEHVYQNFGSRVFNRETMPHYLSKTAFRELIRIIDAKGKLNAELADQIAHAMKEWALEHGATHFTHWFQPMRGVTAEKHDSFLTIEDGQAIERFSGFQLRQSEPDASSFPSGGMRTTFEARGYTAWDPTSPAFLQIGAKFTTLVIPSVYLSFTGEVLDLKTPLLRSLEKVEKSAFKLLKLFGNRTAKNVKVKTGAEQEYFLIDRKFYEDRLDLLLCGRTLLGAPSPKLQQLDDHYFGSIKPKVLAFMEEVDVNMCERGIPFKTRHNEVAPNQFEVAPSFLDANLSTDHNLQMAEIMRHVADDHGFALLLHEKPFEGINGSGKHLNWSLMDSDGNNLLEPGQAPKRNIQFLVFLSAVLIGMQKFGYLLRAAIADAGNDHRLGANEAPPAIMSVFLGGYLRKTLDSIANGEDIEDLHTATLDLKVAHVPGIRADATDRNRTSPVAFTGNKFEVRAVGASMNVSEPTTVMNLMTVYGLERMIEKIERKQQKFPKIKNAALSAVKEAILETEDVCFEGNNYDGAWKDEAEKRELPSADNTPQALKHYLQNEVIDLYEKYEILTKQEIYARVDVKREAYAQIKVLELNTLIEMARTKVVPALVNQMGNYAKTASMLNAGKAQSILHQKINKLEELLVDIETYLVEAKIIVEQISEMPDLEAEADLLGTKGCEILEKLRSACDEVEMRVEDSLWSLPRYSDMLHKI